jgi:hypothetical protein
MGGAPAIPIIRGRDVDGFRKELNPSYVLPGRPSCIRSDHLSRMPHDRQIVLRSLRALMHRVVAGDLEGLVLGRGILRGRGVLGDDEIFFFPVDALEQLAA